jgi:hypothetical protein
MSHSFFMEIPQLKEMEIVQAASNIRLPLRARA